MENNVYDAEWFLHMKTKIIDDGGRVSFTALKDNSFIVPALQTNQTSKSVSDFKLLHFHLTLINSKHSENNVNKTY